MMVIEWWWRSNDDDADQNDHKKLSTLELNKRFMHNYLNTIGKLFTKVGMETYHEVCSRMLHEFKELLRRKPCPLQKMRLLQITVINFIYIFFFVLFLILNSD